MGFCICCPGKGTVRGAHSGAAAGHLALSAVPVGALCKTYTLYHTRRYAGQSAGWQGCASLWS